MDDGVSGFSKRLKSLIEERKITVGLLSQRTDVPVKSLYHWLAGQTPKKLGNIRSVAQFFGVSMEHLLFGEAIRQDAQQLLPHPAPIRIQSESNTIILKIKFSVDHG